MRYAYHDVARDGNGVVVSGATVSVYLAGTTTPATVYTAFSGGSAVNSVTTGTDGSYEFYVDDGDYSSSQKFKLIITKDAFSTFTMDDVSIILPGGTSPITAQSCSVYMSTDQSIPSGVLTQIGFDTVLFDSGSNFDTAAKHYIVPVTGIYQVAVTSHWSLGSGVGPSALEIHVNSSLANEYLRTAAGTSQSCAALLSVTAGDSISAQIYQSSGSTQTLSSAGSLTWMTIYRVE